MYRALGLLLELGLIAVPTMAADAATLTQQVRDTSWELVSFTVTLPNGTNIQPLGPNPQGYTMFDRTGHFVTETLKPGAPKFASNNMLKGTDEENRAAIQASTVDFGTYIADNRNHALIMHVIGASFPNWIGTDIRNVTEIKGDEMTWRNAASYEEHGGTQPTGLVLLWKRLTKNN